MNRFLHQEEADGKWFTMTLLEQMSNIGSEVHRTLLAVGDKARFEGAFLRALELFYLTLSDPRWRNTGRYREIGRMRELYCHAALENNEYQTSLADLDRYFQPYTYAAQLERHQRRCNSMHTKGPRRRCGPYLRWDTERSGVLIVADAR